VYWKISAPSRLHFGLLDLTGDQGRIDGGTGVALAHPRVTVRARGEGDGRIDVPESVLPLVRGLADRLNVDLAGIDLELVQRFPAHVGLGSHTQMALCIGAALSRAAGHELSAREIARAGKRGGTSGIGVNIFSRGGLVVDGGHSFGPGQEKEVCLPSSASNANVPPLLARYELPRSWRFVLVTPNTEQGAHGQQEVDLFGEAFSRDPVDTGAVCRWALMGLMPGAAAGDIALLGRSLSAMQSVGFKRRELSLQPEPVKRLGDVMVEAGAAGAGLTSFGPTVYALVENEERARTALEAAFDSLDQAGIDADGWITTVDNRGAVIERL